MTDWYDNSKMIREAGFLDVLNKLGFTAFAGLVLVMLGSSIHHASQKASVSEEEIQQALNNPAMVEQAQRFIQQEGTEETQEQAQEAIPQQPTQMMIQNLIQHEGTRDYQEHTGSFRNGRFYPYNDSRNIPTVGYGHRILPGENFSNGITEQEALQMLQRDAQSAVDGANRILNGFNEGTETHEIVSEMVFQMGEDGVRGFRNMLMHLRRGEYEQAADEILDSDWATQTPNRARELANRMRNN